MALSARTRQHSAPSLAYSACYTPIARAIPRAMGGGGAAAGSQIAVTPGELPTKKTQLRQNAGAYSAAYVAIATAMPPYSERYIRLIQPNSARRGGKTPNCPQAWVRPGSHTRRTPGAL